MREGEEGQRIGQRRGSIQSPGDERHREDVAIEKELEESGQRCHTESKEEEEGDVEAPVIGGVNREVGDARIGPETRGVAVNPGRERKLRHFKLITTNSQRFSALSEEGATCW